MTREEAIEIARAAAKAKPQSYYAEPFEPHEWVVDAILEASSIAIAERDDARAVARIIAHSYVNDSRPPQRVVDEALAYPTRPDRTGRPLEHIADAKLRAALLRACSMLDDAVQLRDDAEAWFPHIDDLRVIAGGTPGYGSRAETRSAEEIERLRVNRDHSCTCPHQDAREPLTNHGKTCPIRVNKVKRIAPEVAMERLAAALDASDLLISDCVGDPVHGHVPGHWVVCPVCVAVRTGRPLEQDALRVAVDAVQRLVSKAKQFERYPGGEGARRELRAALDALGVLDEDRRG